MIAFGQPPRPMFGMRYAMTGEHDDAGGQFMPGMRLRQLMGVHTGGNLPAMQTPSPMTGGTGQTQPMQFTTGGNLPAQVGGSYMPAFNPQAGGQLPPQPFQPMTGGALQAQSGYISQPQGLAAMFNRYRGF